MTKKLTAEQRTELRRLLAEGRKRIQEARQDEQDRRDLRGKSEPPVGICGVCTSRVVARKEYDGTGRIGGPPPQARVKWWVCEGCGLLYGKAPEPPQ